MIKTPAITLIIFAFSIISRAQVSPNREKAIEFTGKGIESYASDSFERAIGFFNQAIKTDSTYPEARFRRGNAYYEHNDTKSALKDYIWLVNHKTTKAQVYERIGTIDTTAKDFKNAIFYFTNALELDSSQGSYFAARGLTYFLLDQFSNTIPDLERALDLKYSSAEIYSKLGYSLMQQNKNREAVFYFNKAIEKDPRNMADYANRGFALVAIHELDGAIDDLTYYLKYDSSDYTIWYNLARAQYGLKEYDSAIASYKKVLSLRMDYADTWYRLGLVYADKGDNINAISSLTRAINTDPDNPFLYYNRAVATARLNNGTDYCTDLKKSADMGFKDAIEMYAKACGK
jgi:tetratricopeptide (TPR) repeat protein